VSGAADGGLRPTGHASRRGLASYVRGSARVLLLALAVLGATAGRARAIDFAEMEGHVSVGYAKLFVDQAPAGSISFAGGLDVPVARDWRAGFGVGVSLLGTRNEIRGSLSATVDYSTFEALAYAHWLAPGMGPLERVSLGAGLMTARAEISSAGGGLAFIDLARDELVPALALEATLMRRGPMPVRAGLELGTRIGFLRDLQIAATPNNPPLSSEVWAIASARLAIYY
jgi:hypothetical protein